MSAPDGLTGALNARTERLDALAALRGTGLKVTLTVPRYIPDSVKSVLFLLVRHANDGAVVGKTVNPSHACRRCRRGRVRGSFELILKHAATVPHLADEYGVSPIELARAVRGQMIMDGLDPDAGKRARKRRGKWNKNKSPEQAVKHASKMLAQWQARESAAKAKVKEWTRKVNTAQRMKTKNGDTNNEQA